MTAGSWPPCFERASDSGPYWLSGSGPRSGVRNASGFPRPLPRVALSGCERLPIWFLREVASRVSTRFAAHADTYVPTARLNSANARCLRLMPTGSKHWTDGLPTGSSRTRVAWVGGCGVYAVPKGRVNSGAPWRSRAEARGTEPHLSALPTGSPIRLQAEISSTSAPRSVIHPGTLGHGSSSLGTSLAVLQWRANCPSS